MLDVFIYFGVFFFGYAVGWAVREITAMRKVNKVLNNILIETRKELEETLILITIEKHQDKFFVYNMKDNSFMAQGNNIEELEEELSQKYPGKRFAASPENLKEMGIES